MNQDKIPGLNPFDPAEFRRLGHEVIDLLAQYVESSVSNDRDTPEERVLKLLDQNDVYHDWKSVAPGQLSVVEAFKRVMEQSIRLHHPRFLGHQISPPDFTAAIGGLVSDLLNNGMGVYEMGMAGTALERVVVELVAEQFGWNTDNNHKISAGGVLTSGGSLGNLTALLTARNVKLPDSIESGTHGIQPAILVSEQAHYCVQRAVSVMGWGKQGIVTVPTNDLFQMDTTRLAGCLKEATESGRTVIAVVGSACSTATGAYDDLVSIGKFCQENNLWFHVDGAHGAAAAFSKQYRDRINGIELADSAVLDFHKLLLVPALATALVFRDSSHGYQTFAQKADYLFSKDGHDSQWHNIALRSFECTKLMMSLKVFSIYVRDGMRTWDDNVTRLYDMAECFAELIKAHSAFQLLVPPQSNIVCYRFLLNPETEDRQLANRINQQIRARLVNEGQFYVVQTNIDGTHWLRSTIGSATTTRQDLVALLDEASRLGKAIANDAR